MAGITALQFAVPAADPVLAAAGADLPAGSAVLDPAHISFGYPWLPPDRAIGSIDAVAARLALLAPFDVTLDGPGELGPDGRGRVVLALVPRPAAAVRAVAAAVAEATGAPPPSFTPHCSVVRLASDVDPAPWHARIARLAPIVTTLDTVDLHVRRQGRWTHARRMTLGGDPADVTRA